MKTIYAIVDPYMPSQLSVHKDLGVLAKRIGYEYKGYPLDQFAAGQVDTDTSPETLFIFEGADLKVSWKTTKDIKAWFPNAKLIALTGESKTYKYGYTHYTNNPTKEFEFYDGYDVDLWLDGNDEIVEDYRKKGLTVDYWMWTTSHFLIDTFIDRPRLPKTQDVICLIGHRGEYRHRLVQFMDQRYRCQWGKGAGDGNYDFEHLYQSFSGSWVVLGTSSPCWWTNRSVKGWRDWLGPINGTVLIYDDYPDAVRKYPCPFYKYEDFSSIVTLIESLKNDPHLYATILNTQIEWIKNNTIAIQLYDRLTQYKIL